MRRTRKWSYVAQEATRLAALGLSPRDIARRLEVNKSTVTRWMAKGKLTKVEPAGAEIVATDGKSPEGWAKAVREAYALDATDEQLVNLAERALALSLDEGIKPSVRMSAAGRFQAIVRQLALVSRNIAAVEPQPARPVEEPKRKGHERVIRRAAGDPRKLMMVVK